MPSAAISPSGRVLMAPARASISGTAPEFHGRDINATFPDDYTVDALKGKAAIFAVKIKEVGAPVRPAVDDDFAKTLGAENVANLRKLVSEQISREYDNVARMKLKRQMLAQLEKAHTFELPPSLVDSEFESIWRQLTETSRKVLALAQQLPGLVILPAHDPTAAQRLLNS